MHKKYLLRVVAISLVLLILTGCGRTAKTEHWQIRVIDVIKVSSNGEITQMLKELGYPKSCCSEPEPYLAVSVELKNISKLTLEYPTKFEGAIDGYILDSENNIYNNANYHFGFANNWVRYEMPLSESHIVRPGESITDLYIFSVPSDASGLEMILTEIGYDDIEASINLGK